MLKLNIDEKCWYPAVIKIDEKGRNLNWRNTKLMNIEETNRNLKLITIFINFVFRQLRFLPFPSSFITVGYRHFSPILSLRHEFLPILMFLDEHGLMKIAKRMTNAEHLRKKEQKLKNFKQNCWTICQNRAASPRNLRVSQANSHWEHLTRTWTAAIFV